MKRSTIFLTAVAAVLYLASIPLLAQHASNSGGGLRSHLWHHNSKNSESTGKTAQAGGGKAVADHLADNTKLASKLQNLLNINGTTADGMTPMQQLQQDANGFTNLGQFVAAVHVCKNLDIPFDQLKAKMTDPPGESLGKAIHDLKPDASSKAEAKKAHRQANDDIKESESES